MKTRRSIWVFKRFMIYLVANFLFSAVLLPVCIMFKRLKRPIFKFIFLVYPGTIKQIQSYIPLWYKPYIPLVSFIGIVTGKYRGLVLSIPWTLEELEDENNSLKRIGKIISKIDRIAGFIDVQGIALAGRLPGILTQGGYEFSLPLVRGDMGSVYTVLGAIDSVVRLMKLNTIKIGVLGGYGFIGSRVVKALKEHYDVVGVDPRILRKNGERLQMYRDPAELSNCDLIVVLTARGEQIEGAVEHFKKGVIVIDDTHPQLPRRLIKSIEKKEGKVFKSVLTFDGLKFWPPLPNWEDNWLPGCCLEAIVISLSKKQIKNQEEFNVVASQLGFWAPQVKHKSEL